MDKPKFVISWSGGKDSALAAWIASKTVGTPMALLTTCNQAENASWVHHIPKGVLLRTAETIGIQSHLQDTTMERYEQDFETALENLRKQGADACVFGDIDIAEHRAWCTKRCDNCGLQAVFPLWNMPRRQAVFRFLELGFHAVITTVNCEILPAELLGQALSEAVLDQIEQSGADICGENGEYHTIVTDGPLFQRPLDLAWGTPVIAGSYQRIPARLA